MSTLPSLSEADKITMKQYFLAAKSWDKHRRALQREEPNDPVSNRASSNQLILMARRTNPGAFIDGPQEDEDEAESRLARVLSGRSPDGSSLSR